VTGSTDAAEPIYEVAATAFAEVGREAIASPRALGEKSLPPPAVGQRCCHASSIDWRVRRGRRPITADDSASPM
jgi:hypothetical protein